MALVVFTGGARSGKSSAAQQLASLHATDGGDVVVAVFGRESDSEMADRIEHHREQRPECFKTLEVTEPTTWLETVDDAAVLVVDCLGTLLGLVMERAWADAGNPALGEADAEALPEGLEQATSGSFAALVDGIASRAGDTIVVTNEAGMGLVPPFASGRLFRDLLGRGNRRLIDEADAAYLCVAGRMIDLVGRPRAVTWPED